MQLAYFKDELEYVWRVSDVVHTLEEFLPNDLVREVIDFDKGLSRFTSIDREAQRVKDRRMRAYAAVFVHSSEPAKEVKKKEFAKVPLQEVKVEMADMSS